MATPAMSALIRRRKLFGEFFRVSLLLFGRRSRFGESLALPLLFLSLSRTRTLSFSLSLANILAFLAFASLFKPQKKS